MLHHCVTGFAGFSAAYAAGKPIYIPNEKEYNMTDTLKKSYDILLWDLDGTLTDPMPGITNSLRYALSHFGIEEEREKLIPFIGPPLKASFMEFYHFSEAEADIAVSKYREDYFKSGIYDNRLTDGIDALLRELKSKNKRMYIATSKPTVMARIVADHFGITQYFQDICGSGLDGSRSTKESVIEYTLSLISPLRKDKVLMIGDRMHDIIGAKANGIDSVGVLFGYGSKKELSDHGATYLAKNLTELETIIG
jgi:phosphoglycolate phosphatase